MAAKRGMGPVPTLWERLCFPDGETNSRFEDGLQVALDAVVPTPSAHALLEDFLDPGVIPADPWAPSGWGFAPDLFLESPLARPGTRLASTDPHILGLGAHGMVAMFHTPAVLWSHWERGFDPVGVPRRTQVRVNGPLPPNVGPADVALHVVRETGLGGLSGAVLEFCGDGLAKFSAAQRRVLCSHAQLTGCLSALAAPPQDAPERPPAPAVPPDIRHDELLIVNGDQLTPLVAQPDRALVRPVADLRGVSIRRVVVGGCVGGDRESLEEVSAGLRNRRVDARVEFVVVPATERLYREAADGAVGRALRQSGAFLRKPSEVAPGDSSTLTSSTCLAPGGLVADLGTLVASAVAGRPMALAEAPP